MASGEGSKRTRDAKPADRTGGGAPDGLTPGDGRVAKRASKKSKPERKSRVLPLSIALVAFAGAAAIVWYGKGGFPGGVEGEVPIVTASETPDRVAPEDPGGLKIPFQDNAVLNNGEPAEPKVERILPPPEEPMEIARPARPEPADGKEEAAASAETSQESTAPLVPLDSAEEAGEEPQSSAETAAASDAPAADSDPIGALVERMSEGQSADRDSAEVEAPSPPPPPQVTASGSSGQASGEASDVESETPQGAPRMQPESENGSVVQAQASREVGGRTKVEGAESLMAKSAKQPEASDEQRSADATSQTKKTDKKTRNVSIVVPPNVPTIDLSGDQPAPQQASEAAPAQPQSPAPQVAKASPAVVTKEVEQPGKKTNGEKVETLPTEQKPAEAVQVAQPRMADLPKNSYIIQVAALRSEAEAKGFWSKAQAKHPDLLETMPLYVERADLGDRGIYFRVQTGPFPSKATAQDICGQLKSAGQECIVKRRK